MGCAVPRDPRERPVFRSTTPDAASPRTTHVDYLLRFVLERCGTTDGSVAARLDALERTLVSLTRPWRTDAPLAPARELRVSPESLTTLFAWLENGERPEWSDVARLGVYASGAVTDRSVPDGWVRIRLTS